VVFGGGERPVQLGGGQPDGGGVLAHLGAADVGDRGVLQQFDLPQAVVVEPGQAGQPAGDGGGRGRPTGRRLRDRGEVPGPVVHVVPPRGERVHSLVVGPIQAHRSPR
jgi:hypothetical protein